MHPSDEKLRSRLRALEHSIIVEDRASSPPGRRVRLRLALAGAVAVLLVAALGVGAAIVELNRPRANWGAFSRGQPLHCSGIDQMPPARAAAWLKERAITTMWHVEDRRTGQTRLGTVPPAEGVILAATLREDGTLLVLVVAGSDERPPPVPC